MIFKFLEKKPTIDFFTYNSAVYHKAPITKANKQLPDWWKNLTTANGIDLSTFSVENNMRKCSGFVSLFQQGFVIPMWSDLAIDVAAKGREGFAYQFAADSMFTADIHGQKQRGAYLPETDYAHLKLVSPWAAHCNKNIKWLMIQAAWNFKNPSEITSPTGCINYNEIADTHVNLFIQKQEERKQFLIEYGQPLVHLIPLTEDKVDYKLHLVSEEEFFNINNGKNFPLSFSNTLGKAKKLNTCPFKFKG